MLRLWHGETLLGEARPVDEDFPWLLCEWRPEPDFADFRDGFAEARRLAAIPGSDFHEAYTRLLRRGLTLETHGGAVVDDFLVETWEDRLADRTMHEPFR